ncbi:hypothetical protein BY996DRAFT_8560189 [Phakopsora pachyrhizi]|uniref:ABC transporter domain-containing protein n=1 Tax=Phakopsora pachyrhizi TaxID=170000 RepID=A0AAV0ARW5_PHAPC|nr:hypothetical protein BY996DRAFT_8560189 [Phakopsora pachyrhizi]CAH7671336.1 hypothetical protein PPACK8108_LOCUS6108 [Phakopsora pachyrhizi]
MGPPTNHLFRNPFYFSRQIPWSSVLLLLSLPINSLSQQLCIDQPLNSNCSCPIGSTGSPNCDELLCGNPYLNSTARPLLDPLLAGSTGSAGCSQLCTPGFGGTNCNICTNTQACRSADPNHNSDNSPALSSPLTSAVSPSLICSNESVAYGVQFGQCDIINPMIQAVVPGKLWASIEHFADLSATPLPSPILSAFQNASILVKVTYSPNSTATPQDAFACSASNCTQEIDKGTTVSSMCSTIKCTCPPRSILCGGGSLDLSGAIKTISGSVGLDCPVNVGSNPEEQCSIKMEALKGIFGPQGLKLSSCQFGECVQQSTVETKRILLKKVSSSGVSAGLIVGLIIAGIVFLAFLGIAGFGLFQQRLARRGKGSEQFSSSAARVEWHDLRYSLPRKNSSGGFLRRRKPSESKSHSLNSVKNMSEATHGDSSMVNTLSGDFQILSGLSGFVSEGSMMAILGPSGAGKSTFIDVLAGQRKSGQKSGRNSIFIPGEAGNESLVIGFVDQSDILHPTSTVREALMFSACLKLPESIPKTTKQERVCEIIELLGLSHVADSRIGDSEHRGLSGGELRRLSIGLELISSPSVLFLDEPTSGLDSVSALRVVNALKSLAAGALKGTATTVICSIHQPSSQIYYAFDHICLLAPGGRQVYCGPTARVNSFLASHGLACPSGFNPADYLLDIAFDPPESLFSPVDNEKFEPSPSMTVYSASLDKTPSLMNVEPRTTFMNQFHQICKREWKSMWYDPNLFWTHNGTALVLSVFVGGMYFQVNETISGIQNRIGSLFFMSAILVFASLSSLTNFASVKLLFMRERATGYYSPISWLIARVLFDAIPLRILPTLIMGSIIYWMVGLSPHAENFIKLLLVLVVLQLAEMMFNLWLAATNRNSGKAILISSMIILMQLGFAGFFVNLKSVTPVLRWIQYFMPLKYSLEALSENEVSTGLMIIDTLEGVKVNFPAATVLKILFGFGEGVYWKDIGALFAFFAFFSVMLGISVVFKMRQMR